MKPIVILYHGDDEDGFGSAWAAWRKFKDKASYIPVQYKNGNFLPKNLKDREIYLLDVCFDAAIMRKLLNDNKKLVVIDHHIGHKEEAKISTDRLFDLNHSAAALSWKYFHPRKPIPRLLRHIEDMDLWKFRLPRTKELLISLYVRNFNFKSWDKIASDFENKNKIKKYIAEGKAVLKYQETLIKEIAGYGEEVIFEGHKAFAVNSPVLRSEVGHCVNENKKMMGIVWAYKNGIFKGSLRAELRDGVKSIDLSKLAKKFGGGGHKAAAGFIFDAKIKFPWSRRK